MAQGLDIRPFTDGVFSGWWHYALVLIFSIGGLIGITVALWELAKKYRSQHASQRSSMKLSARLSSRIQGEIHRTHLELHARSKISAKPKSFGVYLGALHANLTQEEHAVLNKYELIVLDVSQSGVLDALAAKGKDLPAHVVSRLDLQQIWSADSFANEREIVRSFERILSVVSGMFQHPGAQQAITGLLLSGWQEAPAAVFNVLAKSLGDLGLDVYLEVTAPNFMDSMSPPELQYFAGILLKNGTTLANGEVRDYFSMEKMRSTTKAFVSQACLRPFTVMVWDTVDDRIEISHAVVKRAYNWCAYHGAMLWLGPEASTIQPEANQAISEPLAAFSWLKAQKVMDLHDAYRGNIALGPWRAAEISIFEELEKILPSMRYLLQAAGSNHSEQSSISSLTLPSPGENNPDIFSPTESVTLSEDKAGLGWVGGINKSALDPLSSSPSGTNFLGLGCFPLGLNVTDEAFNEVVRSQRRLRRLGLLNQISSSRVRDLAVPIQLYLARRSPPANATQMTQILREFTDLLSKASDLDQLSDPIQVFVGIDSGFRGPSSSQFWAVYEHDRRTGSLVIYVSKSAQNEISTIMHAYLSSRSVSRYECFLAEYEYYRFTSGEDSSKPLPERFEQDLQLLSPSDLLLMLQQFKFSQWEESCSMLNILKTKCESILLEKPTTEQLKRFGNMDYLSDSISIEELLRARCGWYKDHGKTRLDVDIAQEVFTDVHYAFRDILHSRLYDQLESITSAVDRILMDAATGHRVRTISAYSDLFVFSVFCAARKAAFEEVYVEVSDRNPLFNEFSDQSAAFAELFALGSRCDAYFDITPSDFGKLLSDRHRAYYNMPENQPPMWIHNAPAFASAYAAAQTDIDPNQKEKPMQSYRRFGFLSVFAIPALIDILLLTTIERGLYLSGSMDIDQQKNATLALMLSLLLSGAIGTWISIGGTYYLISMAFSAANVFILTRLIGGLAFTAVVGSIGLVIISVTSRQFTDGLVFFLYLLVLTAYLSTLAALSTYQFPGSTFLNGRTVILALIPVLFISPTVTTWLPRDSPNITVVYLAVLYAFIFLLLLGVRRVGARWVTWISTVYTMDDMEVKSWYIKERAQGREDAFDGLSDPAAMSLSRSSLFEAVMAERARKFWQRSRADGLVLKLARCWEATQFLLDWYCRISDVKKPMPYTSTWNIEVRVAFDSLMQNQKGIRLHNSFIHWRSAGDEIGSGILYFLVALLDRWVGLLYGAPLLGLTRVDCALDFGDDLEDPFMIGKYMYRCDQVMRVAVGFGLAYYLVGAVLLDYKAQHLHQKASEQTPISIQSTEFIRAAEIHDAKVKRRLYWSTLLRFLGVHVWALSVCTALVWVFDGNRAAFITFMAYVIAYTGLLLYQYNKIFSGPHAVGPLLAAVCIGLPLGLILKKFNHKWAFNDVVALGVATWVAALLSLRTAKISIPKRGELNDDRSQSVYHAYGGLGTNQQWSQSELEALYEGITTGPDVGRLLVKPSDQTGTEIKALLLSNNDDTLSSLALEAYPEIADLAQRAVLAWDRGLIVVELASMRAVLPAEADVRAISHYTGGRLHVLLEPELEHSRVERTNAGSDCRIVAETLLHAVGEAFFGLTHEHALISESLLVCRYVDEEITRVPERLRRALPATLTIEKKQAFIHATRRELLSYLCFGLPFETTWDSMPLEVRRLLLRRCLGETQSFTNTQFMWLETNLQAENGCSLETRIARYDLGAILAVHKLNYFRRQVAKQASEKSLITDVSEDFQWLQKQVVINTKKPVMRRLYSSVRAPMSKVYHTIGMWVKFFAIAPIADPEFQRELDCVVKKAGPISLPLKYILTGLWKYSQIIQANVLPLFLFKNRRALQEAWKSIEGIRITLLKDHITIQAFEDTMTAFIHRGGNGSFKLFYYSGVHHREPRTGKVVAVSSYTEDMRLTSREEFKDGISTNEYVYEYPMSRKKSGKTSNHIPLARLCTKGPDQEAIYQYNHKGFVESGSYRRHGNLVRFKYHYRKNAKYDDELLRAEFVLPHLSCNVSWAAPPVRHPEKPERWIPHTRVQEATFVQGSDVYECVWVYNHQCHPVIQTKLNGHLVDTPEMIRHDWLGLLQKPKNCTFLGDNPLLEFGTVEVGYFSRLLRLNSTLLPASTSQKRSQMWRVWKKRSDIDGVVIRLLDEQLLRKDGMLRPYWRRRDRGALVKAEDYLALHADTIMASSELATDISAWTPLAIRLSDLFSFGQGGDAVVYTRTKALQPDTEDVLHVIAVDTGTWPNEGGGVSACRRDLINNLRTVRWNMLVESANDFGIPKFQTQENVESLKIIPLWGLDFMHPVHGMFFNKLDSEVDHLVKEATRDDIRTNFIPTLTALIKGARALVLSDSDVKQATRAFVNLNTYFQDSRHWKEVWESDVVRDAWRHLWLADDIPNTKPPEAWFDTERPTLGHLDSALELWLRYLFIFSIPIPQHVPHVFQASHHSVSAAYGIVCKIKRNCVLQIWDHAISWRETNLYLSSALCTLPPFVRNALLGLMRLTSMLTLHHADYILPCADFFNPGWEIEIGTSNGTVEHRNTFKRKIDPVVNGITDMQEFAPVTKITTPKPTVTMLSHVWFAKDIKTALLAADIIVNQWGFEEYHLDIYGALNKAPIYSSECQEILATKGLAPNVTLRGNGNPKDVLAKTWLFLNSSVSEGLPLALGEAALTGAPVVCTDVGASLRVLTHPESNERYSEVVAPNDPQSLARAQINLLAMLDQWAKYADDDPSSPAPILPIEPTPEDVRVITQRMYEKSEQRRQLGMMARKIVQASFSGERYLREHEQMLWVGKSRYESYGIPVPPVHNSANPGTATATGALDRPRTAGQESRRSHADVMDAQLEKMAHPRAPYARHAPGRGGSRGTSFTSIYNDPWRSEERITVPAGARLSPEGFKSPGGQIVAAPALMEQLGAPSQWTSLVGAVSNRSMSPSRTGRTSTSPVNHRRSMSPGMRALRRDPNAKTNQPGQPGYVPSQLSEVVYADEIRKA